MHRYRPAAKCAELFLGIGFERAHVDPQVERRAVAAVEHGLPDHVIAVFDVADLQVDVERLIRLKDGVAVGEFSVLIDVQIDLKLSGVI